MTWWNDLMTWADASPTLSAIVGGLVVLVIGGIATLVISRVPKLRKPVFGWIAGVARRLPIQVTTRRRQTAALATEYKRGGDEVGRGVYESGFEDGARTVTETLSSQHKAQLRDQERRHGTLLKQSFERGKAARQVEIDAERAVPVAQPQWFPEIIWDGGWNAYAIQIASVRLSGSVYDVTVDADSRLFRFRTAATEQGVPELVAWHGTPTLAGRTYGVDFDIHWTDSIGERQSGVVRVDGTEFVEPGLETAPRASAADLEAAREEGRQAALADRQAALPLPHPRWLAYPDPDDTERFTLRNPVERSVAREVRLDTLPDRARDFEFHDGAHWEQCSGPSLVEFRGRVIEPGVDSEVQLSVTWFDEKGVQHRSVSSWER